MDDEKAYLVMKKWSDITDDARCLGCSGVGMFSEDMLELKMAYSRVYNRYKGVPSDSKIREFNGVKVILQELVDTPMNGRI